MKDGRWGYDSIGNRTSEPDLSTGVTAEYSHYNTNQLATKKTDSSELVSGSFTLKNDPDPTDTTAPISMLPLIASCAGVLLPS